MLGMKLREHKEKIKREKGHVLKEANSVSINTFQDVFESSL